MFTRFRQSPQVCLDGRWPLANHTRCSRPVCLSPPQASSLIAHAAGGRAGLRAALHPAPLLGRSAWTRPLSLVLQSSPQLKSSSGVSLQRKNPGQHRAVCVLAIPSSLRLDGPGMPEVPRDGDHIFHLSLTLSDPLSTGPRDCRPICIQGVRNLVFIRLKISRPTFVLIYLQLCRKCWLAEL